MSLRERSRQNLVKQNEANPEGRIKRVFSEIYDHGYWEQGGSKSGCGSSLRQTETLRKELPEFLQRYAVKKLLDLPCGDFNWIHNMDLKGISYTGGDVVPNIIRDNEKFSNDDVKFVELDIVSSLLPAADCILVRDCFSHLTFEDIQAAIANIKSSNITFLLLTHYLDQNKNADISTGDFHRLNFELEPFSFPPPESYILENHPNPKHKDKVLALWKVKSLP